MWAEANAKPAAESFPRPTSCANRPCRLGLVTNLTGRDLRGRRTIDLLARLPAVELTAIFSPEHGPGGDQDTTAIGNSGDKATGVPIFSVYGATDASRRPPPQVLRELDAVVFDLQDAGVRWYTYETTLGYFLEACAGAKLPLIVLDRPNPITGSVVEGAVSDAARQSFVNYHSIPIRHGLTMGELARLFNGERRLGAQLHVVPMRGWRRNEWFDGTGRAWISPSPNLRSLEAAVLYPGVALVEGANVSVGRGTQTPFSLLGAPWIDGKRLAKYMKARAVKGVRFAQVSFTPSSGPYAGQLCHGIRMAVSERNQLDSPELGLELAAALLKLYPEEFKPRRIAEMLANQESFERLLRGADPRQIAESWRKGLQQFELLRRKYLLY